MAALTIVCIASIYAAWRSRNPFAVMFAVLYVVFVQVGLIIAFISPEYVRTLFSAFNLTAIGRIDALRTSAIVTTGLVIAIGCSVALPAHQNSPAQTTAPRTEMGWPAIALLVLAVSVGIGFIGIAIWTAVSYVRMTGQFPHFLLLRQEVGDNYLFIVGVFNLLPMAVLYALLKSERDRRLSWLFWSCYTLATIALILTFQKRPLIIYLAMISIVAVVLYVRRKDLRIRDVARPRHVLRIGSIMSVPLIFLFALYYTEQNYGRGIQIFEIPTVPVTAPSVKVPRADQPSPPVAFVPPPPLKPIVKAPMARRIATVLKSTLSRTLGRMSMSSLMLINYIPEMRPHYNLTNVGMLARITGRELYDPGTDVFAHFSKTKTIVKGSVATPALIDLYGQFGWTGVVVGSIFLGIGLTISMRLLDLARPNPDSYLFLLAAGGLGMFYLSQANIFRAAMGYGGAIFLLSWVVFYGRDALGRLSPQREMAS
jgi:hypothetical protein